MGVRAGVVVCITSFLLGQLIFSRLPRRRRVMLTPTFQVHSLLIGLQTL